MNRGMFVDILVNESSDASSCKIGWRRFFSHSFNFTGFFEWNDAWYSKIDFAYTEEDLLIKKS